ncbi:MAG: ABC-F family ATP-binding cassette domain-containing protein [Bacteroidetes bacterium]|nr:ABC-F family ATP-binding cassette domain-containing protein [Bacteroidota bacterium]
MNYLSVENLSKNYGDKILFEGLSFGLHKGEKTALIASNGSGKSTLLRILTGIENSDSGQVTTREGIRIGYLDQDPILGNGQTIDDMIASSHTGVSEVIRNYHNTLQSHSTNPTRETETALELATTEMDHKDGWDYERRLKQLLSLFRITDTTKTTDILSGGEKKRLALAMVLLNDPDLLILDEPTNHLDVDMIEWLEKYLSKANLTLLMVTHDRYFLDRVCNRIMELNQGRLFYHQGNYEYFLQKKAEREEVQQVETDKARQLMKKELEWLRRMPRARTHKSKSRIQAFDGIKEKAKGPEADAELKLQMQVTRMGGKILEIKDLKKRYGNIKIIDGFSYVFRKGERIGIIGRNGSGKTSFLNLMTGREQPDEGTIETGETVVFGYYTQSGIQFPMEKRVIDVIKEIAEFVRMGDGSTISASRFLEHFMFPPETQYKLVESLSGGEKRRLNLLTVLIKNPNFLILDEPTNDLDLLVLNRLEEFLLNYTGCLVLVSHDRYFLDKLTDHLFIFEGEGKLRDYYGRYSDYHLGKEKLSPGKKTQKEPVEQKQKTPTIKVKTKLTFKEQREYESLEKEIEQLELEKITIESSLHSGMSDYEKLNDLSERLGKIMALIDEKTLRWMELDEFV